MRARRDDEVVEVIAAFWEAVVPESVDVGRSKWDLVVVLKCDELTGQASDRLDRAVEEEVEEVFERDVQEEDEGAE